MLLLQKKYIFRFQGQLAKLNWKGSPENFVVLLALLPLYLLAHHWIQPWKQLSIRSSKVYVLSMILNNNYCDCECTLVHDLIIIDFMLYIVIHTRLFPIKWWTTLSWILCFCSSLIHHLGWSCSSVLLGSKWS